MIDTYKIDIDCCVSEEGGVYISDILHSQSTSSNDGGGMYECAALPYKNMHMLDVNYIDP